jgi:polyisoprenoid-binding protein YceI
MAVQLPTEQRRTIVPAGTWKVDPAHSTVEFAVKHMMIATVKGRFTEFEGTLEVGDDPRGAKAFGTITVASIDTHEAQRDGHLRSVDFFDAERFPAIRFESKRIEYVEGALFRIVGDLTIRDVSRELDLEAAFQGAGRDPYGDDRVALEIRGEIDRKDFGLTWNQVLETGGFLVGDTVKLAVDISAVKAAAAQAA